jgi:hypothetical protein
MLAKPFGYRAMSFLIVLVLAGATCNLGSAAPSAATATQAPPASAIPTQPPAATAASTQPAAASETPASTESEMPTEAASPAPTGERGTPEQAQAMLQAAVAHYDEVGREQALADFNAPLPQFKDPDLYVA